MRILLVIILTLETLFVCSQQIDLKDRMVQSFLDSSKSDVIKSKRRLMFKKPDVNERVGPVKSTFAGLMFLYQNVFSEQISASCIYEISCSEYTKREIEKYGLFIGSIKGFHQLMHCTHGAIEEVPPYMKSSYSEKIKNSVE
jgi:putative component of membrane protein insertase Oxa1/YidC/SpoIIIJ protein YidD